MDLDANIEIYEHVNKEKISYYKGVVDDAPFGVMDFEVERIHIFEGCASIKVNTDLRS